MAHDPYNTTNEDAVSNLSMLSTSTMRSSLYFHEKPDRFEQQAGPLADILDLHQDVRDRQASGTSSNSQGNIVLCTAKGLSMTECIMPTCVWCEFWWRKTGKFGKLNATHQYLPM